MILPFSTQLKGKPTYFVERITSGLILNDLMNGFEANFANKGFCMNAFAEKDMKIHTIREDLKCRWKLGVKIDFFINCRQKDMFRFAPVLPVVSIQLIQIIYKSESIFFANRLHPADVYIDKRKLGVYELLKLSQNDGFDTIEDFLNYFSKDFDGKIIHWTEKRY